MEIIIHHANEIKIAEVTFDGILIANAEDGLDLLGNLYYQDVDRIIIHEKNISSDFFDLKTGIAGEILQKFSNYRVRLAIVGDFSAYQSKSIRDFIFESNKFRQINFVASVPNAISKLSS
ncbi:DUF4180 domain-containing protein [Dyadobacter sp. CY312]|nr:DUF4180 domain-containing protein [Dyadobacter sp. CY312]